MAETRLIPTPLIYRWRRFLQRILPFIIFAIGVATTVWLWDRQSLMGNATGVVNSKIVDVSSGIAGILLPPSHGTWQAFQPVKKNEVIGAVNLFEDDTFYAQLATIEKQKDKVHADLAAERERFVFDTRLQSRGEWFDVARLWWQVEQYMLDIKDRTTRIKVAEAELKRLQQSLRYVEETYKRGATSEQETVDVRLQRDTIRSQITQELAAFQNAKNYLEVEKNRLKKTRAQLAALENEQSAEIGKVIEAMAAPYFKQIDVLNAQANEIQSQLNPLLIRAPIDGIITQVFAVPGQSVQPGDPVVRIIAAYDAQYIVSYIRDRQRIYTTPGMLVRVRKRFTGSRPVEAQVLEVGGFVEEVPLQHRVDPVQPEWGYPVTIEVPADLRVRPGEGIEIIFPRGSRMAEEPDQEPTPNVGV